ncbi:hypothetical protein B0H13DRAFT_1896382 [Mycena leptocephala]|nr:hypothetical protein B0H13DRAFT_1896382 [Mycena leptocephala]
MSLNLRVHPSSPRASKGTTPPQLDPGNKENAGLIPPRPNYANLRRPSAGWLVNPAWIDGGLDPPQFYHTQEDILSTLYIYNPLHHYFTAPAPALAPAPPAPGVYATGKVGVDFPRPQEEEEDTVDATQLITFLAPSETSYQVNVSVKYSAPDKLSRGMKVVIKKYQDSKFGMIDIAGMDRCTFVQSTLAIHPFGADYSPGVHQGPPFKISWTGSPGGKSGAVTIDNDQEWEVAAAALKRKNTKPAVHVEYNLDNMAGYRVRKRPHSPDGGSDDPELLHGTKVPHLDNYSPQTQVNGP